MNQQLRLVQKVKKIGESNGSSFHDHVTPNSIHN